MDRKIGAAAGRGLAAFRRRLGLARADERGATTIVFALVAIFVLLPLVVISVNIWIMTGQRSKLQDAVDAAALFAARSGETDAAKITEIGNRALAANLELIGESQLVTSSFTLQTNPAPERVVASATVRPWTPVTWCNVHSKVPWCFMARNITIGSEVVRATDKLEIALVLDNTGSMGVDNTGAMNPGSATSRISILKTEAAKLVDSLAAIGANQPGKVKLSLVPFSNTVRVVSSVNLTNYNPATPYATGVPNFIDPTAHNQMGGNCGSNGNGNGNGGGSSNIFDCAADRFSLMKAIGVNWNGCVEARADDYDISEVGADGNWKSYWTPYFWPDEVDDNASNNAFKNSYLVDANPGSYANGNANQKKNAYQAEQKKTSKYTSTGWHANRIGKTFDPAGDLAAWGSAGIMGGPYYYGPNAGCELQPLVRLTNTAATVKTAIANMTAIGETHIPIGLAWGWHTLSPSGTGPYGDGASYSATDVKKYIILMTDGDNTMYPAWSLDADMTYNSSYYGGYGYVWQKQLKGVKETDSSATRTQLMDSRMLALCDNIKKKNITIYTIGVVVTSNAKTNLSKCASTEDGNALYYDVAATSDLGPVFQKIAAHISKMRISR